MMKAKKTVIVLGLLGVGALTGCYTRTVKAKGLGAEWGKTDVYEPNVKSKDEGRGLLDGAGDVIFGGRKIEDRRN